MIKIEKSQAPAVLNSLQVREATANLRRRVQQGEQLTASDFQSSIYAAREVKEQLLQDQHHKCAYCEVTLAGNYGAVEHYRPKSQYIEDDGSTGLGYYWLAYAWDNLLCSCDKCNGAARKGCHFPLRNPATRDVAHVDISREEPLIIQPASENPGDDLCFREHIAIPKVIDQVPSDKGQRTIELFDLNGQAAVSPRRDLVEARRRIWCQARELYDCVIRNGFTPTEATAYVCSLFGNDDNQFAGMFRNQVKDK
jgi:uncharacterized protein (TIGR02646 family)